MKLNITLIVYLNTKISTIHYMFVKYYLRLYVLILSKDLLTDLPTNN